MQLFALDNGIPLLASHAHKHHNYQCPECKQLVRLRSGPHRQPHYYHLHTTSSCRQHQKSAEHLQAQLQLFTLLPEGECALEHPFPALGRIADAFWEKAHIVFEIQCSPISQEEVEARTRDYRSIGMQVVWILHDIRFNRKKLSQAEHHLRSQCCYYTNITSSGRGIFYDQFEILNGPHRLFQGPPLPTHLHLPVTGIPPFNLPSPLPSTVSERVARWELSFPGDLLHRLHHSPASLPSLLAIEQRFTSCATAKFNPRLALRKLYLLLLDTLLRAFSSG